MLKSNFSQFLYSLKKTASPIDLPNWRFISPIEVFSSQFSFYLSDFRFTSPIDVGLFHGCYWA